MGVKSSVSALAAALVVAMAPALAWACPACAGRDGGGYARVVILGAMIVLPFATAFTVWRVVRQAQRSPVDRTGCPEGERP